ncbi:MAG: hypothetical protein B7C24_16620 [Bacteroidetes bacterium 4572_77]|nr:MAG: hypothetical protein B7C24_16620 [Bacteroidetes bacterium 4572_77]
MISFQSVAQSGSNGTYSFLTLPNSARVAGMGSNFLTIKDNDINLALNNPSLITAEMHNNLGFSFVDYYADIKYGYATYGRSFNKLGNFVGTMQFVDYGDQIYADETGQQQGTFNAGEYAMNIGWGRALDSNFYIGANLKGIFSNYESYSSFGLAIDVAATYYNPKNRFSASLILSNIGRQLKTYNGYNEPLPFEIKAGLAKSMEHIPLTFSVLFTNLQKWDLTYTSSLNQETDPTTGEIVEKDGGIADFGDKLMRHVVIGAELRPFKVIRLRVGYNYLRRKEMVIKTRPSTVGWSWGVGVKVYKFEIAYSRSAYHLHPSFNYFTLTTNLDSFFNTVD